MIRTDFCHMKKRVNMLLLALPPKASATWPAPKSRTKGRDLRQELALFSLSFHGPPERYRKKLVFPAFVFSLFHALSPFRPPVSCGFYTMPCDILVTYAAVLRNRDYIMRPKLRPRHDKQHHSCYCYCYHNIGQRQLELAPRHA